MVLEPLQAVGGAAIVFFLLLGALYLLDPSISGKAWLGIIFVMIGVTILLILVAYAPFLVSYLPPKLWSSGFSIF